MSSYDKVIIQDEQLSIWKIKHGKKVHHSILGRVKTKLKNKEKTSHLSLGNKFGYILGTIA